MLARWFFGLHSASMLPDEQTSPEQIAIFRAMTPEQRWNAARQLYWTVGQHKEAFLRSQHQGWTEERLKTEVRDIFLRAGS